MQPKPPKMDVESPKGSSCGPVGTSFSWAPESVLIALTGNAGCGKSTVDRYLVEFHHFVPYAFADPLKSSAEMLGSFEREQLHGDFKCKEQVDERWGVSPRVFMQLFGDVIRGPFSQLICEHAKRPFENVFITSFRLWNARNRYNDRIVSDCRFDDEAKVIKELGGQIIRIVRPGHKTNAGQHVSECGISDEYVDFTVINDVTEHELKLKVEEIARQIARRVRKVS